jgi:hypothetical protein
VVRAIIEWASNGFKIMCALGKNKTFKSIWVVSIGVRNMGNLVFMYPWVGQNCRKSQNSI